MTADRYGNTRVAKIRAAYNDLRQAIRAGDIEAAERALDRYEQWADYVFQPTTPAEAARVLLERAYLAGFNAAGEGRNGEYPFRDNDKNPADNASWRDCMDVSLRALIAEASQ